jgi:opacity protein-like surface antigen
MRKVFAVVVFGIFLSALPAGAQDQKPVDVNFGFGWAFPVSNLHDSFDTGWSGAAGATFNITPYLGIQGEYTYARLIGPDQTINVGDFPAAAATFKGALEGTQQMHVGTFNLVSRTNRPGQMLQVYGIGGGGFYYRRMEITSASAGYATYCDPYWYVCNAEPASLDKITGLRTSTDFGLNVGGGVTVGKEAKFFAETRYHYVWGPKIGSDSAERSNVQFFPLTFGVRW